MPGLFASLNSTAQALGAQTVAIATTSKNLANINNASYSREYVVMGSKGAVQTPQGTEELALQALSVQQDSDSLQNQQVIRETALASTYTTEQGWYQQAQAALGETVSSTSTDSSTTGVGDTGLAQALDSFQTALQNFAATPTDNGAREALVQVAGTLSDTFNQIDGNLAAVQTSVSTQIANDVTTGNTLLTQIAQLNSQIASAESNNPGSAVDFRDQREAALEKLAAILPISVSEGANGEDTVTTPDTGSGTVTLVNKGTVTGPLAFNSSTNTLTGGAPAATLGDASGSIAGGITAMTGPIKSLRDSLDALAKQLVTSFNGAYNTTSSATGNFFTATGTTAATISVDSNLSNASLVAGSGGAADNTIALAMAALANQKFSVAGGDAIDGTLTSSLANTVSNLGQSLATANTNVTDQSSILTLVTNQRAATSGVNLDEEMSNLVQYQRAYQASSHVFNIIDDLLNTVVNQLGN
jgi:flagellar hook-associated protein 1 FlgK